MAPLFEGAKTQADVLVRAREELDRSLQSLEGLIAQSNAFDLLGLVRMYTVPPILEGYRESESQSSPATLELVASMIRHRAAGDDAPAPVPSTDPGKIVSAAERAIDAHLWLLLSESTEGHHPLAELAGQFRMTELRVRGRQYQSVQSTVEDELFGVAAVSELMDRHLGFSYNDIQRVRVAFGEQWSQNRSGSLEELHRLYEEHMDDESTDELRAQLQAAMDTAMFKPGVSMTVTAEEISRRSGLSSETCTSVLDAFALPFDTTRTPIEAAQAFLRGDNELLLRNLLKDSRGRYFGVGGELGIDGLRPIFEEAIKPVQKAWDRYQKYRGVVAERLAARHLQAVLQPDRSYESIEYFRPIPGTEAATLGSACDRPATHGEPAEADLLMVIDDVAICVEVKAAAISTSARRGSVLRLAKDLEKTVGDARSQADRLADLIERNHGLWVPDEGWLDLSEVREVRSIAVTLEDLSSLNCSLDALVRARVMSAGRLPWVVSLHDLIVTTRILDRASEFLLYLRRRTDSEVATRYSGIDELDFVMLFVEGQLWVDLDPAVMNAKHPKAPRLTGADRARYRKEAQLTRVGTHTDDLDAWMYHTDGLVDAPADRPSFRSDDGIDELVDALAAHRGQRWLPTSTDLLNGSSEQRASIMGSITKLLRAARGDGKRHSLFVALPGPWGFSAVVFGTGHGARDRGALAALSDYAAAKQYQLEVDRCLTVLLTSEGAVLDTAYRGSRIPRSAEMELRATQMGLQDPPSGVRKPPPYARRTSRRLRGRSR